MRPSPVSTTASQSTSGQENRESKQDKSSQGAHRGRASLTQLHAGKRPDKITWTLTLSMTSQEMERRAPDRHP